jgi:hypothetical protein
MQRSTRQFFTMSFLAVALAATLAACSEDEGTATPLSLPELGACEATLQVPDSLELVSHLYATGVQIYRWNDTTWVAVSPSATLFTDPAEEHVVGIHYSGPTWEGLAGSKVVGAVIDKCTPDANAIPWLILSGTSDGAPGEFQGVTRIQRVNTTGGKAPVAAGTNLGQVVSVPYTTEYFFYAPR